MRQFDDQFGITPTIRHAFNQGLQDSYWPARGMLLREAPKYLHGQAVLRHIAGQARLPFGERTIHTLNGPMLALQHADDLSAHGDPQGEAIVLRHAYETQHPEEPRWIHVGGSGRYVQIHDHHTDDPKISIWTPLHELASLYGELHSPHGSSLTHSREWRSPIDVYLSDENTELATGPRGTRGIVGVPPEGLSRLHDFVFPTRRPNVVAPMPPRILDLSRFNLRGDGAVTGSAVLYHIKTPIEAVRYMTDFEDVGSEHPYTLGVVGSTKTHSYLRFRADPRELSFFGPTVGYRPVAQIHYPTASIAVPPPWGAPAPSFAPRGEGALQDRYGELSRQHQSAWWTK